MSDSESPDKAVNPLIAAVVLLGAVCIVAVVVYQAQTNGEALVGPTPVAPNTKAVPEAASTAAQTGVVDHKKVAVPAKAANTVPAATKTNGAKAAGAGGKVEAPKVPLKKERIHFSGSKSMAVMPSDIAVPNTLNPVSGEEKGRQPKATKPSPKVQPKPLPNANPRPRIHFSGSKSALAPMPSIKPPPAQQQQQQQQQKSSTP